MIVRATRKSVVALPYDELPHWFAKIGAITRSHFSGSYARVDDVRAVSVLPATDKTTLLVDPSNLMGERPLPGDVVVFVEITESVLSDASPAEMFSSDPKEPG